MKVYTWVWCSVWICRWKLNGKWLSKEFCFFFKWLKLKTFIFDSHNTFMSTLGQHAKCIPRIPQTQAKNGHSSVVPLAEYSYLLFYVSFKDRVPWRFYLMSFCRSFLLMVPRGCALYACEKIDSPLHCFPAHVEFRQV